MQITAQPISEQIWQQVSALIESRTGLHFPRQRFADLECRLDQAAREAKYPSTSAYVENLLNRGVNYTDFEILAANLTVGETHFMRDACAFEFLQYKFLPGLIAAKRGVDQRLRIWSAGCATGEEPYSFAMLLHHLIPNLAEWQITILGSDINPKALAKAATGIYSEWSFRDTPAWVKPRYFTVRPGGRYEILPELKRMVRFACLNLMDPVYPSVLNHTHSMDLIICRNVLFYFKPERVAPVVQRFHRALADGGRLALGVVEISQIQFPGGAPVLAPGLALYQKLDDTAVLALDTEDPRFSINAPAPRPPIPTESSSRPEVACPPASHHPRPHPASPAAATPRARPVPLTVAASASSHDAYAEALLLYTAGRYLEACSLLLVDVDLPCDHHPQSAMLLAQCHANLGELTEALAWCERALADATTDPARHFLRAVILQELQRDDEALRALRDVLFLEPTHLTANFSMANLYRRRNQGSLAAKHVAYLRHLLAHHDESDELPQSGGLTVGRLNLILTTTEDLLSKDASAHA